jgi:hypothetical protein
VRHRMRHFPLHDQAGHTEGSVDAAPAIPRQIESNEQVTREERSGDIGQLAGVAYRLEPLRQKDFERLVLQLAFRTQLAMRLRVDGIPASGAILDRNSMRRSPRVRSNTFRNKTDPLPNRAPPTRS